MTKIGVYVCECGNNIAGKIDINKVLAAVSSLKDVTIAERYKLLCAGDGQEYLKQSIKEHKLTHIVIAACSPKQHELTFMNVCQEAGLNPYLFQLVNIREQCAWITPETKEATSKAIRQVRAAINRVQYQKALEEREIECNPNVLVIGGGIAGIRASQVLASPNRKVYLVEKTDSLGGNVKNFTSLYTSMESGLSLIENKVRNVKQNKNIEVFTDSEVSEVLGFLGNFEVMVATKAKEEGSNFKVGAVVLATGFNLIDLKDYPQYRYGSLDNVYTSLEFEAMNLPDGPTSGEIQLKNGQAPKSIAIIHCVGREERGYCSKVCCMYSFKFDRVIRTKLPESKIVHFYSDICIPGKTAQIFFEETKRMGVEFIYSVKHKITSNGRGLLVNYQNGSNPVKPWPADMVVLLPAMENSFDTNKFADMLNLPLDEKGFFAEEHQLLSPVASAVEGVYIIGCARGPQSISESIVQAEASAGKILSSLVLDRKLKLEAKTCTISDVFCTGCQTCLDVCPYGAIHYNDAKRICIVNEVLCHGCGNCAAACPSDAAKLKHFTFPQIYQEVVGILRQ